MHLTPNGTKIDTYEVRKRNIGQRSPDMVIDDNAKKSKDEVSKSSDNSMNTSYNSENATSIDDMLRDQKNMDNLTNKKQ